MVSSYGYGVVAGFIAIEGMGVPLPGELVLVTAAAFAAQGDLTILNVVLAAWAGTIVGGTGGYWIGSRGGAIAIQRYGHRFGLTEIRVAKARTFFEQHGAKTVIIARFIAILRMIAGILAGATGMSFGLFTVCNAAGGLIWAATFGALGYVFGQNLPLLEHYLRRGSLGTVVAAAVVIIAFVIWRRRRSDPAP
ncbi:MAG: DedA family protein [Gemmatimonadaceae bacterium]